MILEKIIGSLNEVQPGKEIITLPFEWYEQNNKILKKAASSGEEIGVRLANPEPLYDGAVLFEDENKVIALSLVPCEVTRVYATSIEEMGRACYELGNRHVPLSFEDDCVCVPYDRPTFEYLKKKGFCCELSVEKFCPQVMVRGHSHG